MTMRIDADWIAANPLPPLPEGGDKNSKGRVLVVGGAEFVPGALRLTGEAALRAGAGKVQMATVRAAAMSLGVLVPEAAMIALPADEDGEIAVEAADILLERVGHCDVMILGPGMSANERTASLVGRLLAPRNGPPVVLDAAALTCARDLAPVIAAREQPVVMTPHEGEMALLLGMDRAEVENAPREAAQQAADRFRATVLLKGGQSWLASPGADALLFDDGCIGLATGGSGDVLAGVIGGLLAQGASPALACAWGCFIHGNAGQMLTREIGQLGFLARELVPLLPRLLQQFRRVERHK
jgi:hydroxyethylthiazole kinase-like uncharacterized protein yjeF